MKNLIALCPTATDATSWYRGTGPLAHLRKKDPNLNITILDNFTWSSLQLNDAIFLQRPYNPKHVALIKMAKDNNLPVWVDYDDDLFCVPNDNPAHKIYSNDSVGRNLIEILTLADIITVSTKALEERIRDIEKFIKSPKTLDVRIIPNAINKKLFPYRKELHKREKIIVWRGSPTHQKDVMSVAQAIIDTAKKFPDWKWHFIGDGIWFLQDHLKDSAVWVEAKDILDYQKYIYDLVPSILIAPLTTCSFNKAKSNIAWIEASFAGAVCIGPNMDEWKKPGMINYTNEESFKISLEYAIQNQDECVKKSELSWEYIMGNLTLDVVNEQRSRVVQDLFCLN